MRDVYFVTTLLVTVEKQSGDSFVVFAGALTFGNKGKGNLRETVIYIQQLLRKKTMNTQKRCIYTCQRKLIFHTQE